MTQPSDIPSRLDAITTRWSLLREAHGGEGPSAGEARGALVLRYLPAVKRYVRAIVQKDDDADDITQDVVVRLLSGDFAGADPARGRFRNLLKVAIRNMIRNHWKRSKRRRPADVDLARFEEPEHDAPDDPWLGGWRESVLDLTWKALKQEERRRAGALLHTVLKLRAAHPDDTSAQLAARLSEQAGRPIRADAVRQQLHRARARFADLLIVEVAKGLAEPTPARIEDELIALGLWESVKDLLPAEWGAEA